MQDNIEGFGFNYKTRRIFVVYLVLCGILFWRLLLIPERFATISDLLYLGTGLFALVQIPQRNLRFKLIIFWYFFGLFCNALSAQFNNSQSINTTYWYNRQFYYIIFYFTLHYFREYVNLKFLETLIIVMGVIYCLLYLRIKNVFPQPVISAAMFWDRGTLRLKFPGNGFQVLGYFLLLNKFLIERKWWQIALALFFFSIMFLSGYRTLAAAAVLLSAFLYLRLINRSVINYLMVIPMVLLVVVILQTGKIGYIFDQMISTSQEQVEQGDDYIRFITMEYYKHAYPQNFSYYIFGGGAPAGNGPYATYMTGLNKAGMFWVDLGIIGYYWVVGLLALIGLVGWGIQTIFTRIPSTHLYLKLFFVYLIIVSFTTMEIFNKGMFAVQAMALFLVDLVMDEKKEGAIEET